MSPRNDPVRLRPLRLVWFAVSSTLTVLALVAVAGVLPAPSVAQAGPTHRPVSSSDGTSAWGSVPASSDQVSEQTPASGQSAGGSEQSTDLARAEPVPPAGSGAGRRVVFDLSDQRVWLVRDGGAVRSTYLVSGSVMDNLHPGRYHVYSRSQRATSYDYTSTMRWMVRFTEGATAAIGFHAIPRDGSGQAVQSVSQLGTPQSHGCIRQALPDAVAMWRFATAGTTVVVV
jgi:hypothetical protein